MVQVNNDVFQKYYDSAVKAAYQAEGKLRNTVTLRTNVVGTTADFRKIGKGMASKHISKADVSYMNIGIDKVTANLTDWDAYDLIDNNDLFKSNIDEVGVTSDACGKALGRRIDQIIIDAINAGYDSTNMKFGTTNTALTVAKLIEAKTAIENNAVSSENLTFIHSATQKSDLLQTTQITSSEYNDVKALVYGNVNRFLGMDFIMIPKMDEGGLPDDAAGTGTFGFIYDKAAVGLALSKDINTIYENVPEKLAHMVGGSFSAGAVVIDNKGIAAVLSKK